MATIQHLVGTNKIKDEWQKINANFDALNAENNGWRIYNDVTELGLTPGSETMEAIVASMANRSMLIFSKTTGNASPAYPMGTGLLIVTKHSNPRTVLEFYSRSSGRPVKWVGYYDANQSPNFSGWSQDALEYETGNFTPELQFGGSSTGITYQQQIGRYTRVGNVVYYSVQLWLTSKGSATGAATIEGLPFASLNAQPNDADAISTATGITLPSGANWAYGVIFNNATTITLRASGNVSSSTALTDEHFSNNTLIRLSGHYFIA